MNSCLPFNSSGELSEIQTKNHIFVLEKQILVKSLLKYLVPVILVLTAINLFSDRIKLDYSPIEEHQTFFFQQTDSYACKALGAKSTARIPQQLATPDSLNLQIRTAGSKSFHKNLGRIIAGRKYLQFKAGLMNHKSDFPISSSFARGVLILSFLNKLII